MHVTVFLYLPEYYNPDSEGKRGKIEEDKFIKTAEEIALQLSGGGVWHPHYNKSGIWYDGNIKYSDDLRIFEFDIVNKKENKHWLIPMHKFSNPPPHLLDGGLYNLYAYRGMVSYGRQK